MQKRQISEYKQQKRRTDEVLNMGLQEGNFYERKQNFGFPITTTTAEGGVFTTTLGAAHNAMDALTHVKEHKGVKADHSKKNVS